MDTKELFENIETIIFSENIDTVVNSYINASHNLKTLYEERIEELSNGSENNVENR